MAKIIRLTESDLVRIVRNLINEQPGKIIGQNLVRPVLNLVRGQGGKQISKTAKLGQEIKQLKNILKLFNSETEIARNRYLRGEITYDQYMAEFNKLKNKYNTEKVKEGILKRRQQIQVEKNKNVVANTPQENIIKSRYEAMRRGSNISQGGQYNEGVFDLGNGYVAKISKMGWDDPAIQNLKWKDKIQSPRVMKTIEVKSFIDSQGKEIVYQVQQKATGRPLISISGYDRLPKIHRENFKKDLEELYKNNVFVDPNAENFLYDPNKGIQFVDLGRNPNFRDGMMTPIFKPEDLIKRVWPQFDTF